MVGFRDASRLAVAEVGDPRDGPLYGMRRGTHAVLIEAICGGTAQNAGQPEALMREPDESNPAGPAPQSFSALTRK